MSGRRRISQVGDPARRDEILRPPGRPQNDMPKGFFANLLEDAPRPPSVARTPGPFAAFEKLFPRDAHRPLRFSLASDTSLQYDPRIVKSGRARRVGSRSAARVGLSACRAAGRLFGELIRDRVPAAYAKGLGGDFQGGRGLLALVFGLVDPPQGFTH